MTELLRELREIIAQEGPISLERYMTLALSHPRCGYYTTREPFGAAGDFVTAPEISQMFGELIGLWALEVWRLSGAPGAMRLVELGPGRGTLMADALRAIRKISDTAIEVHLVETSARLAEAQRTTLAKAGVPVQWRGGIEQRPSGASVIIANDFLDALPVQHYVRTAGGWCERLVGLDANGLAFGLRPNATGGIQAEAPEGSVLEIGHKAREIARILSGKIAEQGGALLILDYGYTQTSLGETLQAVHNHRFVDPLEAPGECDLTAHVDFASLKREAEAAGVRVHGPVTQG
ncbi:MAG: SAM-dependent methyltransferase, partial [Alphaproteobacteria bacterium]|nr:SAM-dependent methyltransferase [Alphaproteobacteria bacterium]